MKVIEQHSTPDGLLKFIVEDYDDDIALGFEGCSWHTHPECLPPYDAKDWKPVVKQFIEDLLADRLLIGVEKKNGQIVNAWVADEATLSKHKPPEEVIEFRYWSGREYEGFVSFE